MSTYIILNAYLQYFKKILIRKKCQKVPNKKNFQKLPNKKSFVKKYLAKFFLFQRVPINVFLQLIVKYND